MRLQLFSKFSFAALVSLLLPGLGHLLWGEWLFGLFVFLIMFLGLALFYLSFIMQGELWLYLILLLLPTLFSLFALVDLRRSIQKRRTTYQPSPRKGLIFLAVGLIAQLSVPGLPASFISENHPSVYRVTTNDFSPLLRRGDVALTVPTDYYLKLFFFDRALYQAMPERYDLVRYLDRSGEPRTGLVIGLPEEEVEVVSGVIVANGLPIIERDQGLILSGDCSLTSTGPYSILLADLYLGSIRTVREVSLFDIVGKVRSIL